MVTFVEPMNDARLRTIAGLEPGVTVRFRDPAAFDVSVTITSESNEATTDATSFGFSSQCGSVANSQPVVSFGFSTSCLEPGQEFVSFLGTALASTTRLAYSALVDVPVTPTIAGTAIPWVGATTDYTLDVTNLPTVRVWANARLSLTSRGQTLLVDEASGWSPDAPVRVTTSRAPDGPVTNARLVTASVARDSAYSSLVERREGPVPSSESLDFGASALPLVVAAALYGDPERPTVGVLVDGDMGPATGGSVTIAYENSGSFHQWSLSFAGGPTVVRFPELPTELRASVGPTSDSVFPTWGAVWRYWKTDGLDYVEVVSRGAVRPTDADFGRDMTRLASSSWNPGI